MKRVRVYQQILSEDNLRLAIREVNRGHRRNGDHSLNKKVLEIEANMDQYVAELRRFIEDLVSGDAHMHPPLKRRRWATGSGTVTPSSESTTCFGSSSRCIYITTEGIETGSSRLSGPPA